MTEWMRSNKQQLVMPYPIRLERQFGAMSLDAAGLPMSTRLHKDDWELARAEAKRLGMGVSTLSRWFIVHGYQQLAFVRTGHYPVVRA